MKIICSLFKLSLMLVLFIVFLSGCVTNCKCDTDPLKGTDTVAVLITVKKDGMPQVNKETVTVKPGQRLVFVGPSEFTLRHRDDFLYNVVSQKNNSRSANKRDGVDEEISTADGVINLQISEEYSRILKEKELDEITIKYDVIVNGVALDPFVKIIEH